MTGRRPLYGWLTAEAVSLTGTRVSMIALPFLVLTTTGSATKTGLVALCEALPMVLLKVLGGPVIDRLGARRVSVGCDLGSLVVVGAIPVLHEAGVLSFPALLGLVALAGGLRGPGDAAKHALVPVIVEHARVPMERVTGLAGTVERTSSMLGAALAGVLVAALGATNALVIDAASFGVSALVLLWSTSSLAVAAPEPEVEAGGYRHQLREGWDFLRGDRVLLGITVMVALTNLIDAAYSTVLIPVWAVDAGRGAGSIGLVFAVFSGSSALGSVCAATWASGLSRYRTYLVAFLICGAPRYAVFAFDSPLWTVVLVVATSGFAAGFINPVLGAVIFERIPTHLVGRVSSLTTAMCFSLIPLGGVLGGLLVTGAGLPVTMLAVGAAYLLVTMLPAVDPRWREIDIRRPVSVVDQEKAAAT
ncbi:MFS transporter [Nocardioides sp. T2.26MG-1]|uniref:MFS transporter n=1 Tax=Nocardioides sp. T2.26MG-1 TaxID=3041166 RepID=UPI0024776294|nr:MFS transporter [Nocardioides sp. T2.26MG-1]CAI9411604.1 Multidrug efflux pump Tap [Nocardioides sp. T2.26MG-1]